MRAASRRRLIGWGLVLAILATYAVGPQAGDALGPAADPHLEARPEPEQVRERAVLDVDELVEGGITAHGLAAGRG